MADEELGSGSITISLTGEDAALADARRLGDRIERVLDRASRDAGLRMQRNISRAIARISPARIRVEADLRAFGHSIDTLANFPAVTIPVDPDVDRERFEAAIQAALTGLEVSVRVVPDLDGFDRSIRAHNAPDVTVNVDVDRAGLSRFTGAMGKLGSTLGSVGSIAAKGARLASVGIAAVSAAQGVLALTAALAPAAGIIAALPAVIGGVIAAEAAFKLATVGVGDALKAAASGDAEKLAESLKKLSPSAREAVSAFAALQPRLKALQQSVQEAFFTRFSDQVGGALKNLTPLQSALGGISAQFGRAASEGLKFAATKEALAGLRGVLAGTHAALSGLAPAVQPVLKGFLDVASSVSTAFGQRVGTALRDTASRFGDFLSVSAASGRAVAWVDGAVALFRQLGIIASNVGGIISGVFRAANNVGGGLINNLRQITQGFEDFVKSAAGQEAIGNIFATLSTAAAQLAPILGALVQTLGAVAPALAPLFTLIGPAITGVITSLQPVIENLLPGIQVVVAALVDGLAAITSSGALSSLGAAFGRILTAVAPLLPLLGELIGSLGTALAPVLSALASALAPVVSALSAALLPVLPVLTSAIVTLAQALTPVVTLIGTTLTSVITALAPLLASLAAVIATVVTAVAPLILQITDALLPLFVQLGPVIAALVSALAPLITALVTALLPVLPPIIEALTAVLAAVIPIIPPVAALAAAIGSFAAVLITTLAPVLAFVAGVVSWVAINAVTPIVTALVNVIATIADVLTAVIGAVTGFVPTVVAFFQRLGVSVTQLVGSMVTSVIGFFRSLPGKAVAAVSLIVSGLSTVFVSARNAVLSRVTSMIADAVGLFRALPGKITGALSGAGTLLVGIGRDIVQGLINGIKGAAGAVASAAASLIDKVPGPIRKLMGIHSPSTVMHEIGKFIGQGLVNGMASTEAGIKAASDKLVKLIRDAFKGRNTRIDDVLVSQIQRTEKTLLGLAKRREAIAARIKAANEFASQTAQAALQTGSLQTAAANGGGVAGITEGIDAAVAKIKKFNRQVADLAKRGLSKGLLSQIIGLGPDQGAGLAATLGKATGAQLKDLNEAQKQLEDAAKKLGQTSADAMFDSGKQASAGFLAGLKAQQADLNKLMRDIGKQLASSIRSALGIHSPSKVMAGIGVNTMRGLELGVKSRLAAVRRMAVGAADSLSGALTPNGSVGMRTGRQAGTQGFSSQTNNRTIAPVINITEVGDARATAERVIQRLVAQGAL